MLEEIGDEIRDWLGLGLDIGGVNALQMALRALIIYAVALVLVRLGSRRFLARATAFDFIIAIMIGSIMSRAINGSAPFLPTVAAGAVLVGSHWLLGALSARTVWIGPLVKGNPVVVIRDGEIVEQAALRAGISRHDLEQAMRLKTRLTDLSKVKLAYLERNGDISVIPNTPEPRVLAVSLDEGVQTIRIELQ